MDSPWYRDGLRFSCTRCGGCCTGEPGNVYVDQAESRALAERLGMDEDAFRRRYTRTVHRRGRRLLSLVEKPNNDCVFFDRGRGCTVYEQRPRQCRTWPFWRVNIASADEWEEVGASCPGVGSGRHWTAAEIDATAAEDGLP